MARCAQYVCPRCHYTVAGQWGQTRPGSTGIPYRIPAAPDRDLRRSNRIDRQCAGAGNR